MADDSEPIHVLLDSCIYRADRKRSKSGFRALVRLARAGYVQLHVPAYVKGEVITQQQHDVAADINSLKSAADAILRTTDEIHLQQHAKSVEATVEAMKASSADWLATEFDKWLSNVDAIVHPVKPHHAKLVTDAYFEGKVPFRAPKHRPDIPDAFIWQVALDLAKEHGKIVVISTDGRLRETAAKHDAMTVYKTLEEFIEIPHCQELLRDLVSDIITDNLDHLKRSLPRLTKAMKKPVEQALAKALVGHVVKHDAIPDDNHEAFILDVEELNDLTFDTDDIDYYGAADFGINFTATLDCRVNYSIFKGDYYSLDDEIMSDISVDERNDHYFDAEQTFNISVQAAAGIVIDTSMLEKDGLTYQDLTDIITQATFSIDIISTTVNVPLW